MKDLDLLGKNRLKQHKVCIYIYSGHLFLSLDFSPVYKVVQVCYWGLLSRLWKLYTRLLCYYYLLQTVLNIISVRNKIVCEENEPRLTSLVKYKLKQVEFNYSTQNHKLTIYFTHTSNITLPTLLIYLNHTPYKLYSSNTSNILYRHFQYILHTLLVNLPVAVRLSRKLSKSPSFKIHLYYNQTTIDYVE